MKVMLFVTLGLLVSSLAMAEASSDAGKVTITGEDANYIASVTEAQGTTGNSEFTSGLVAVTCYRSIPLVSGGEVQSPSFTCVLKKAVQK